MPKIDKEKEIERLLDKGLLEQLDFIEANLLQGKEFYLETIAGIIEIIDEAADQETKYNSPVIIFGRICEFTEKAFQTKIEEILLNQ